MTYKQFLKTIIASDYTVGEEVFNYIIDNEYSLEEFWNDCNSGNFMFEVLLALNLYEKFSVHLHKAIAGIIHEGLDLLPANKKLGSIRSDYYLCIISEIDDVDSATLAELFRKYIKNPVMGKIKNKE